jgi:hypothetical protein
MRPEVLYLSIAAFVDVISRGFFRRHFDDTIVVSLSRIPYQGLSALQEGGFVLLAALLGLPSHVGLALSLAKRTREILPGLPALLYLHLSERAGAGAVRAAAR